MARATSFEREIFQEILNRNGMVVTAKGMGFETVLCKLLKLHCNGASLVFVLNAASLADRLISLILADGVAAEHVPQVLTSSKSTADRAQLYLEGGCFFVTSRILILDLLQKRVQPECITGLVVLDAHRVTSNSVEAFILRLYRAKNSTGFVKAFSDNAESLAGGFAKLTKVMESLRVQHLFLWPRFRVAVKNSVSRGIIRLSEWSLPFTKRMAVIQNSAISIMKMCIKDIASRAKIDPDEISLENCLNKSFQGILMSRLSGRWDKLSYQCKQSIRDLGVLRKVLSYLIEYDSVTFHHLVETIWREASISLTKASGLYSKTPSPWLVTDEADQLLSAAIGRVFKKAQSSRNAGNKTLKSTIEESPKWLCTKKILEGNDDGIHPVVIFTGNRHSATLLKQYLCSDGQSVLRSRYRRYLKPKLDGGAVAMPAEAPNPEATEPSDGNQDPDLAGGLDVVSESIVREIEVQFLGHEESNKRRKIAGESEEHRSDAAKGPQLPLFLFEEHNEDQRWWHANCQSRTDDLSSKVEPLRRGSVIISCIQANETAKLRELMDNLQPKTVIVYEPRVDILRALEVFASEHCDRELSLHFVFYSDGIQLQQYNNSLQAENRAFERLIEEKGRLVFSDTRENRPGPPVDIPSSSRAGGSRVKPGTERGRVVVDVREFRSELPSMLHRAGLDMVPVTLETGDYIITPEICVERKSIPDMMQSFASGRLFKQVDKMQRHFKVPVLLIEWDSNRPFYLVRESMIDRDLVASNIHSKLVLLTLKFRKLRLLWMRNPTCTASMFNVLKRDRQEPDTVSPILSEGVSASSGIYIRADGEEAALEPMEMLRAIPGVSEHNWQQLVREAPTLLDVSRLSKQRLKKFVGAENAAKVHRFFHGS